MHVIHGEGGSSQGLLLPEEERLVNVNVILEQFCLMKYRDSQEEI